MQIQRIESCPGEDVSDRVHQIKPKGFVALYITYVWVQMRNATPTGKVV